jgi:hypothetical protein
LISPSITSDPGRFWHRLAALLLVVAALGLPINDLYRYALLLLAAVAIFVGSVSREVTAWLAAIAVVALTVIGRHLFPAPVIEEGHNVFIVDARNGALERGLPAEAFRLMAAEFDAQYPPERRCDPRVFGCWRGNGFPERAYAFSADGIYDRPGHSRRVTDIDFADPVRLRLGFINEHQYNWTGDSDLQRGKRQPRIPHLLRPWRLTMPFFVMYSFPADFVGSRLCWQGEVLWETAPGQFARQLHREMSCRPIGAEDVGRRLFGVSISTPLAMKLEPTLALQLRRLVEPTLVVIGAGAVLLLLLRWRGRQFSVPFLLIGLSLLVVVLNDVSLIGGVRPFDGGDDGLVYEGHGRRIVQHLLAGNISAALEGNEKIYYYGGPGLRYFRALERLVFGDSFLGYLSLILALPCLVLAVFRRFLSDRAALALTLVFIAIPIGAIFGTTYYQYVKWVARGFADPAAATVFLTGLIVLVGRTPHGPDQRFAPALGAGLLFALALWLRPNLAPGAAVLLGGAGLHALWQGEYRRLAGMCIGFAPVFGMALHNWVFGGEFVLFSSNVATPGNLPTPPSVYLAALGDLVRLDLASESLWRVRRQLVRWLAGPSEFGLLAPLHLAAVIVVARMALGRGYDPWLRLIAGAALALQPVAWFYPTTDRYHLLMWFLIAVVCAVWMRDEGLPWLRRRYPDATAQAMHHPASAAISRLLDRWASAAAR